VVIARDGQIKNVKIIVGHPARVNAVHDNLKNSKACAASGETTAPRVLKFQP